MSKLEFVKQCGNVLDFKPARKCERCWNDMEYVGKLPKVGHKREARVFICPKCKHSLLDQR
jgi:hypothetical protein